MILGIEMYFWNFIQQLNTMTILFIKVVVQIEGGIGIWLW